MKVKTLSRVRLFATLWTVAYQAPPSMGFSRQESWSGLPFPSPGDLPNLGIEPESPALQAITLAFEPLGNPHVKPSTKNCYLRLHLWVDLREDIQGPCSVRFRGQEFCIAQSSPGARTASSCLLHLLPPLVTAQRFLELPVCAAYTAELSKKRHKNELLLSKGLNSHY